MLPVSSIAYHSPNTILSLSTPSNVWVFLTLVLKVMSKFLFFQLSDNIMAMKEVLQLQNKLIGNN
jgi:hypothetical protein